MLRAASPTQAMTDPGRLCGLNSQGAASSRSSTLATGMRSSPLIEGPLSVPGTLLARLAMMSDCVTPGMGARSHPQDLRVGSAMPHTYYMKG